MHTYTAYNLVIVSELLLPELSSFNGSIEKEMQCLSVEFGHARRDSVKQAVVQGLFYHIQPNACWLSVPGVASFLIKKGHQIIIEPCSGADEDSLRLFLYMLCLPLVLIYHGFFLLHGGAVHLNHHGLALLANFGQGTSTLLVSFLKSNYGFLSDSICVINKNGELLSGFPYLQLREDVIRSFDWDLGALKLIRPELKKWFIPVQASCFSESAVLKTIYVLNPTNRSDVLFRPFSGLKKVHLLKKYIYQPTFVKGLGKDLFYFNQCAVLAASISAFYVERPKQGTEWHDFFKAVENHVQHKAMECL